MTATRQKAALEDYDIARGDFGIDPDSVIKLAERSNSYWLKLRSPAGSVEGKLHLPEMKNHLSLIQRHQQTVQYILQLITYQVI